MATRPWAVLAAAGAAAVAFLVVSCGSHDSRRSGARALGSDLESVVVAGVPGALVLVADDAGALRAARGVANRATGDSLRATDRFRVGSITKTFVAACVLQLVAEGKLELDVPVERWLPGLVREGITVRHLLAHTSGLADYVDDPSITSGEASSPRELTRRALARATIGAPGERYLYSSTNYLVLGLLVERVTGANLDEQLARRIFRPLELANADQAVVLMANSHSLTREADTAIHRTLDDAYCRASD